MSLYLILSTLLIRPEYLSQHPIHQHLSLCSSLHVTE
jgi:hypothetical protein